MGERLSGGPGIHHTQELGADADRAIFSAVGFMLGPRKIGTKGETHGEGRAGESPA
jgi:hypothetical protein